MSASARQEKTTIAFPQAISAPCASTELVHAWMPALESFRARRPHFDANVGAFAVFAQRGPGLVHLVHDGALPVDAPHAIAIGRHACCDVVFDDACVALRHVLVLVSPSADGVFSIEALDLRTDAGIGLDGRLSSGVVAKGVVQFVIGSVNVVVMALSPADLGPLYPDELEVRLSANGARAIRGLADVKKERLLLLSSSDSAHRLSDRERERIRENTRVGRMRPFDPRDAPYMRTAGNKSAVLVRAREDEWVDGIVLGRYTRCDLHGTLERDDEVSRVHALLIARADACFLIDLGSTNGTSLIDVRTRKVRAYLREGTRLARLEALDEILLGNTRVVVRMDEI
jgi:pSer/pThr/pTyr-binding forkhead associated (FHA) protein